MQKRIFGGLLIAATVTVALVLIVGTIKGTIHDVPYVGGTITYTSVTGSTFTAQHKADESIEVHFIPADTDSYFKAFTAHPVQHASHTRYESSDGRFVFLINGNKATIEVDGEPYVSRSIHASVQPTELSGTNWKYIAHAHNDTWTEAPSYTTITISFENDTLHGNAGCNTFFSSYTLKDTTIHLDPIGSTLMACDDTHMHQEFMFLDSLQKVHTIYTDGTHLILHHGDTDALIFAPQTTIMHDTPPTDDTSLHNTQPIKNE